MCLDIDPDSVIHKHLVKKINDLDRVIDWRNEGHIHNQVTKYKQNKEERHDWVTTKHDLTMLPSFHISLGAPLKCNESKPNSIHLDTLDIASLVGWIALAPINISKKDNKQSAWVPLYATMFRLMQQNKILPKYINLEPFHSIGKELHISLANLTGNPHDSIARPEDCIIDTINN